MNVGYDKVEYWDEPLTPDTGCKIEVVYDVNHYFHTDYGRDSDRQVYNEKEFTRVKFRMTGPTGTHELDGSSSRKRVQAHWNGFVANNGGVAGKLSSMPRKHWKRTYWC